jgi:GNAT superfamily N-acetyltransferase
MGESPQPAGRREASPPTADHALRRASAEDVDRLKAVLAAAFYEDPIMGWMMPDEDSRDRRLRRFFEIELSHVALVHGAVWTSTDLGGAAMSSAPGSWKLPQRALLLEGQNFGSWLSRATDLLAAMYRRHPSRPHYYFRDIGVLPERQGQGLGSALMRPTLERCDREGLPAYLEASTERSAALYERLGFQYTGEELRVGDSPSVWPMLRPPAAQIGSRPP